MILCICASPALDLTYRVDRLAVGGTNRVRDVIQRPGGKAVNVTRVLHTLDEDVHLLATAGGETGAELAASLDHYGITHDLVPMNAPTRRTVTVVDDAGGTVTTLNEAAVLDDWPALHDRARTLIPSADVVVISGALPAGAPPDAFAQLTSLARDYERLVVIDTSGSALPATLSARPTAVKPNADELKECTQEDDPLAGALALAEQWQVTVLASLGADGLLAVDEDHAWRVRPAHILSGNPTGAGDAVVAGLARGLQDGADLRSVAADCVALASAAVIASSAGEIDLDHYRRHASDVVVESVERVGR